MINIVEVGPRDGLQNEPRALSVEQRVKLIDKLSECGFTEIEVGSFVSPKHVPQMADTDFVFFQIKQHPDVRYSVLVPNQKGFDFAIQHGVQNISVFTAATDDFNQRNIKCSIAESLERYTPIISAANQHGMRVRGYVSCITHCPYSGSVEPEATIKVAASLLELGCAEISLGETLGQATPEHIDKLLRVLTNHLPVEQLALHCHDTYGYALDNIEVGLSHGITTFDSAINGLGGCPFASDNGEGFKPKGNVATESLVEHLIKLGHETNIDMEQLQLASQFAGVVLADARKDRVDIA